MGNSVILLASIMKSVCVLSKHKVFHEDEFEEYEEGKYNFCHIPQAPYYLNCVMAYASTNGFACHLVRNSHLTLQAKDNADIWLRFNLIGENSILGQEGDVNSVDMPKEVFCELIKESLLVM